MPIFNTSKEALEFKKENDLKKWNVAQIACGNKAKWTLYPAE